MTTAQSPPAPGFLCLIVALLSLVRLDSVHGFTPSPSHTSVLHLSANRIAPFPLVTTTRTTTQLFLWKRVSKFFGRSKDKNNKGDESDGDETSSSPPSSSSSSSSVEALSSSTSKPTAPKPKRRKNTKHVSVCIVGGGVSGLTAGMECATKMASKTKPKQNQDTDDNDNKNQDGEPLVVILEASSTVGGRVQSDTTPDGYTLDRGFAVFIEEYPFAQKLLDYSDLQLGQFLPGALVKVSSGSLARVADPLRQPGELFTALLAPVGSLLDKIGILFLVWNVRSQSLEKLFQEKETSTIDALTKRWNFSEDMIEKFFTPFLEGIYLAPLQEQSSRMFSFVFKMFSEGSASLPRGGIGAVAEQLKTKAESVGVDICFDQAVETIEQNSGESPAFTVYTGDTAWTCDSLIVATEGDAACKLISQINGFESLETLPGQVQRQVGNVYYGFEGEPPVQDPILILNGMKGDLEKNPVNNVCFPSSVTSGYAPEGCSLCSVTILKEAMDLYQDRDEELDAAIRKQLSTWFPSHASSISDEKDWQLKGMYRIANAQPGQFKGPFPANVNGGRPSNSYRNKELPAGIFVCGDHMSTATLNGALESGVAAGAAAAAAVP